MPPEGPPPPRSASAVPSRTSSSRMTWRASRSAATRGGSTQGCSAKAPLLRRAALPLYILVIGMTRPSPAMAAAATSAPGNAATRDPRLLPLEMAWWLAAGGKASDTSAHVLTEVWRRAAQKDLHGLRWLANGLERLAFPAGSCSVSVARCGGLVAANIVVAISALEVHLALAANKLPRWSRRVIALMSPALRSEVAAWSSLCLASGRI